MRGVYAIQCGDGRCYVGASRNIRLRWNEHRSTLRKGKHGNPPLQDAWDTLGEEAFSFVILERVPEGDLVAAEQRWIDHMAGGLFNRAPLAGSTAGIVHTEATRAKLAAAKRGTKLSPEHRANIAAGHKGRKASPAHRANGSAAKTGSKNPAAKITAADVPVIRQLSASGMLQREIGALFGITGKAVSQIVRRRNWAHIPDQGAAA